MSGFDPRFDAAGTGTSDGSVPAPGNIDGYKYFLRADGTWNVPRDVPHGDPPPAPGPDLDLWACNIAGYLIYEVAKVATKFVVDWLPTSWIGDVVGGITVGVLHVLLPPVALLDGALDSAIFTWVSTYVSTHVGDLAAALVDDVAWAKLHCALYDKIKLTPTDLRAAILAFTAILGGLVGWTTPAVAAITYFLENVGITDVSTIPITAFVRNYDCSSCAITGIGPTKPILQSNFDLTITDGTTSEAFTDTVTFVGATVSGTPPHATVTLDGSQAATTLVTDTSWKARSLWTGSSNSAAPAGWQLPTFSDAAWANAVTNGINHPPSTSIWSPSPVGATGQISLFRKYVILPPGTVLSASVVQAGGDALVVYVNGIQEPATFPSVIPPAAAVALDPGLFIPGATNLIAVSSTTAVSFTPSIFMEISFDIRTMPTPGVTVEHASAGVGTERAINLQDSTTVAFTVTDDTANNRIDISATATSVSGGAPMTSPLTTKGDLIVGATGGTPDRLAVGSANTLLQAVPAATDGVQWVLLQQSDIPNLPASKITTGQLALAQGGTGLDTSGVGDGDLLVGTSSHTWVRGGMGGGNGITVSELAGIFTIASNLSAGTNISLTVVGGAVRIDGAAPGAGAGDLVHVADQVIVGSSTTTISFTSIRGDGYGLLIQLTARCDGAFTDDYCLVRFNNDSGSNYDYKALSITGSNFSAQQLTGTAQTSMKGVDVPGSTTLANVAAQGTISVPNYADTTFFKGFHYEGTCMFGSLTPSHFAAGGQWRNTGAVTRVDIIAPQSSHWVAGTHARLYVML